MSEIQFTYGMSDAELAEAKTIYAQDLLKGQRALITGGGSGIGYATAWLFARLGATVILTGRNEDKLQTAAATLHEHGLRAEYQTLDIREPETIATVMDQVFAGGGLDILVNNAGGQFPKLSIDLSPNGWASVINNNLNGTWFMMQAAAQRWRDSGTPGNIINMVVVTDDSMHGIVHTCAARAGVIKASQKACVEWAPYDIRINCVAPGVTDSSGMKAYSEEARKKFHLANPMQRACSIWDIAQACAYLGSEASNFITGEVLHLDGGSRHWGDLWTYPKPEYFSNQ
ncbi:SDR family oxidoreductase [Pseudomaricurvus alkylphenolicus]|uniref:SDR family oxidoreductase n=1 Tax=Pseudomaricurvus alkylphenolicus TaxID=1306991 RepID=UPI0014217B39|nr:SDR family oxidoreductase [Pseudomaricurvus alkylphenolicus]NIB42571.1 SDR family oxidoreductase [Pseudomaricurvus alkylphenolicus]